MNKQEAFDTIVKGMRKQGRPSTQGSTCLYRCTKPDGTVLKCAVGMLIPDDMYVIEMENKGVTKLFREGMLPHLDQAELGSLLSECQNVHDMWNSEFPAVDLRAIAKYFKLTYPEAD